MVGATYSFAGDTADDAAEYSPFFTSNAFDVADDMAALDDTTADEDAIGAKSYVHVDVPPICSVKEVVNRSRLF
jgi:hypothetical protein